jgi:hypothetical protein
MQEQFFLADGHIHIYPAYDINSFLSHALQNLRDLGQQEFGGQDVLYYLLLVERADCHFFQRIEQSHNGHKLDEFVIQKHREELCLHVLDKHTLETRLYLVAGRQINSKEGLEICSIGSPITVQDNRENATKLVELIEDSGGVPTLNWAPGKWMFGRKTPVLDTINSSTPLSLFIGDTSMRPTFWPTPGLMKYAAQQGFRSIAGSDPLPFRGEEKQAGTFAFYVKGDFNPARPGMSLIYALKEGQNAPHILGRRRGFFNFIRSQTKIMIEKRNR